MRSNAAAAGSSSMTSTAPGCHFPAGPPVPVLVLRVPPGRQTVNAEPCPGSECSSIRPPCAWTSRRVRAGRGRCRPVERWGRRPVRTPRTPCSWSSARDADPGVGDGDPDLGAGALGADRIRPPSGVNLIALDSRLSKIWRSRMRVGGDRHGRHVVVISRFLRSDHRAQRGDHVGRSWPAVAAFEVQVDPPGLDLGQVQNVVDQIEQVPAAAVDVAIQSSGTIRVVAVGVSARPSVR